MMHYYETIEQRELQDQLWSLCERLFIPLCEETPIHQFYPKELFYEFLVNPEVKKFVAIQKDQPFGICLLTHNIALEPILNPYYFQKHYPDRPVYLIMIIGVDPAYRADLMAIRLLRAALAHIPPRGIGVFVHSDLHNPNIPRFANLAHQGEFDGLKIDAESCWLYFRK